MRKQTESKVESCSLHLYVLLMFHNRVAYLWVQQGHDAFCDALHLDQAVIPVSRVLHRDTGAQRVITQGKITAPISSSSNKLL